MLCRLCLPLYYMTSPLTIYRASAGSGKTFTLTAEYVALLLATHSCREAEHILAVTFTNKATAEMKDRILTSLYILAHNLKGSKDMMNKVLECLKKKEIILEPNILHQRAKAALSSILHDYSHFRVETIDSFFQSILHSMTRELGLTSGLRIELNNKQVVERAVERVMEHLSERPKVKQWILDYVREQIESSEQWDIRKSMNSLGGCIYEEAYQKKQDENAVLNIEEQANDLKQTLRNQKKEIEDEIRQQADDLLVHINNQELTWNRISYGSSYESFLNKASKIGREEKKPSKYEMPSQRIINAAEDPEKLLKSADRRNPKLMEEAVDISIRLKKLCTCYREGIRKLNSISLTLKYLSPLCLLDTIEEEATGICTEEGQFLLSKTAALLSKMVEGSDAPFILERAGTQFQHVMIDEFQDTSRMQWDNFRNLLIENLANGGHSLLVGDVKQSIYRWRGGDWEILQGASEELKHLQPEQTTLNINWRSCPEVVNFNNTFFPEAARLLDEQDRNARFKLADIYADVAQECARAKGEQGYVGVCLFKNDLKSDEYEERMVLEMIDHIRQLKEKGVRQQDIAILVRRNQMATQLLSLFHTYAPEISLVSEEAFLLQASLSVQMLVAAMELVADGIKKINPVVLKFLTIHYQKEIEGCNSSIEQLIRENSEEVLPTELVTRRDSLTRLPLLLLAERLYHILHLEKIKGQDAYILTFMDELQSYLRDNPQDIHQFLRAWKETISTRSIPSGETGGIRILTIHKSKGLEYHTILLPYMDWNMGINAQHETLLWCETDEAPFNQIGTLPICLSTKMENSVFSSNYQEEMLQKRVDTLNLIYVAFTRAQCNLLIWGKTSGNEKLTNVGNLIYNSLKMVEQEDSFRYEQGELCSRREQKKKSESTNNEETEIRMNLLHDENNAHDITMSTHPPTIHFMQSEQARLYMHSLDDEAEEEKQEDKYIESGKLMHYALSLIGDVNETTSVLNRLEAEGYASQSMAWKKARRAIEHGLTNPTIAQWFAPGKRYLRECGIITRDSATGQAKIKRPDRVIMEPGLITVVDYKFGKRKREYEDQVKEYMQHVSKMYPDTRVEGWLWYVYSGQTDKITLEEKIH